MTNHFFIMKNRKMKGVFSMKKFTKKCIALILCMLMLFPVTSAVTYAADGTVMAATPEMKIVEKAVGGIINAVIGALGTFFTHIGLDSYDDFMEADHPYFYEGTDGKVSGDAWKLGYASTSYIPVQWRENAEGEKDPDGYCLNKNYYFGGYFTAKVNKIYDDQTVNLAIMSCGTDNNRNGVEDILIMASIDGIGFSNQDVLAVREATITKLARLGVKNSDILGFNMTATHAHSVVDPQGMGLDIIGHLFLSRITIGRDRSIEPDLLEAIINNTSDAAVEAYTSMEEGNLYFYETADLLVDGEGFDFVKDKRNFGQDVQNKAGCFLFEAVSGEKTIMANLATHPTKADRGSERVCADFPYYVAQALMEMGYNFLYFQGAQGSVALDLYRTEEGEAYATANALTYEDWVARYGTKYADEHYTNESENYYDLRAGGYTFAKLLVDSSENKVEVAPSLDIKMSYMAMPLDYGLLYAAGVSQLLGFNCVRYKGTQTGYAIMTEVGYISIGDDVTLITTPGETFPAIPYGIEEGYTGEKLWTGSTSWSGEDWQYKALDEYVRIAKNDEDHVVLALGLTNDALGYIIPDTDCSHMCVDWFYGGHYEELLTCSKNGGSALAQAFVDLLGVEQ